MRIVLSFLMMFFLSGVASADDSSAQELKAVYQFRASYQVSEELEQKLALAKANNKKLLVVLGAKWCHDSAALSKHFSHPNMDKLLQQQYEVLFVSVGYLNKGFNIVERFGLPVYYGTPTVMVIDPKTERLLNEDSMGQWLNAANKSSEEYQQYFSAAVDDKSSFAFPASSRMNDYLVLIDRFEQEQALRIKRAFQRLGPVLEGYKERGVDFTAQQDREWRKVSRYRYKVQQDVVQLKQQAMKAVTDGEPLTLSFPDYERFSWE